MIRRLLAALLLVAVAAADAAPRRDAPGRVTPLVAFTPGSGPSLADARGIARIDTAPSDAEVVRIAAADLRADLARVSGRSGDNGGVIWLGTLGHHPGIDRLAATGRLDVRQLKGAWESYVIATVRSPAPRIASALVIAGSDRRGTAYGAYEVSRAIGVSPWHWWADVTPQRHATIRAAPGARRFGPPSVRYRGLFLNDEDWGLEPWARTTFEPEAGTIGPRTYTRLFDLMLRMRANLLWPAMHKVTRAFNANPANAALADRYAIVMGSSHAEPMLRDNVGEWTAPAADFNYLTNAKGVADYWRARVAANARYESIWTLGMRGIHDSGIVGPTTDDGRRALLDRIIVDQRAMLADAGLARAPQVFTPYKEVLGLYRAGLKVPADVTLMWPDDNFGYIRQLPDAAEAARPGGSGVYYHLSYLGAPLSYLWLSTTPPALIREEMGRAYDAGARAMWVFNVGDLKPAELDIDYAMRLAWDVPSTRAAPVDTVVADWAAANIGTDVAPEVAAIMAEHHRLNFARRPEHLQWWLPGEVSRSSPLSPAEVSERLAAFAANVARVDALAPRIAPDRQDAWFELVAYPVTAAALANVRVFEAERHDRLRDTDPRAAADAGARARLADTRLTALTRRYNEGVAGGKWRGMIAEEPADGQWRRYRLTPPILTAPTPGPEPTLFPAPVATPSQTIIVEAESATPGNWTRVDGLGRNGAAVRLSCPRPSQRGEGCADLAFAQQMLSRSWERGHALAKQAREPKARSSPLPTSARQQAAKLRYPSPLPGARADHRLAYTVTLPPGRWRMIAEVLPTFPAGGRPLALDLAIDAAAPATLSAPRTAGDAAWSRAVLDNRIDLAAPAILDGGTHRFAATFADPAVILDRFRFEPAGPKD